MKTKEIVLAYKSRPNEDGKSTYVEFVGIADKWVNREIFTATCEITHYSPFFVHISKKEWRRIRGDKEAILKKYTKAMDELFDRLTKGKL